MKPVYLHGEPSSVVLPSQRNHGRSPTRDHAAVVREFRFDNKARPPELLPPNWEELSPLLDELLDAPVEDRVARIVELSRRSPARQRELEPLLAEAERETPLLDGSVAHRFNEAHAMAVGYPDGYGLAKTGDTLGARQPLRGLDARPPAWGDETQRAMTYLGLGDTASALSALGRNRGQAK